ncbi:GNAT family N-acetyltransferase [Paraburkholderia bryophila]|uniref:GNAT family N-acetyltransferase n=1 Tax=Paraburkholderia bryophila TaxID=420952 RepID=UPI0038B9A245
MLRDRSLFAIRSVPAEQVYPIRSSVLLDGDTSQCRFRGDDQDSTLHLAICDDDAIVAAATVCQEAFPGSPGDHAWRLRGVAVEPSMQRYGFGRMLIKLCFDHARKEGGRIVWCTARESARGFYEALGFASASPPFTLPTRGDVLFYEMHYVLPGEPVADVE